MSLVASAHMRMKKKREKSVLSPTSASSAGNNSNRPSPRNAVISPRNNNAAAIALAKKKAAVGGALSRPAPPSADPPLMQQQQHQPQSMQQQPSQAQQQHAPQHHQQQVHQRVPPINRRRGYGSPGGGINTLDNSGEYVGDNHSQSHWQQQHQSQQQRGPSPSPSQVYQQQQQQQQQQQRGMSPSPSPQYHPQQLHPPSPGGVHPHQIQQPQSQVPHQQHQHGTHSPVPGPVGHIGNRSPSPYNYNETSTFESATRYQGNYTSYLAPRHPARVPNRPRRRYDSFTEKPEEEVEQEQEEVVEDDEMAELDRHRHHQQQQQLDRQHLGNRHQNQQQGQHHQAQGQQNSAFDPFANQMNTQMNSAGVHASHRASPYFQQDFSNENFPSQQLANNNGMQNNHVQRVSPMLNTIEGNKHNFVYDPEEESQQLQQQEEEDENAEMDAISLPILQGEKGGNGKAAFSEEEEPPSLMMNHYDFEYHTEKDEGSTFDGNGTFDGGNDGAAEGRDAVPPLLPRAGAPPPQRTPQRRMDSDAAVSGSPSESRTASSETVGDENQTVDSERALYGTPVVKKHAHLKAKKRRGHHKARVIIDNVDKAAAGAEEGSIVSGGSGGAVGGGSTNSGKVSSGRRRDPRHAMHYQDDIPEEENEEEQQESSMLSDHSSSGIRSSGIHNQGSIASSAMRGIAAHARKFTTSDSATDEEVSQLTGGQQELGQHPSSSNPFEDSIGSGMKKDSGSRFLSPPRMGLSKSWDSQDVGSIGNNNVAASNSFTRNLIWDDLGSGNGASGSQQQQQQQRHKIRASKSWDEDNNNNMGSIEEGGIEDSIATWGTWGDNTASLFGASAAGGSAAGTTTAGASSGIAAESGSAFGTSFGTTGVGASNDKENSFGSQNPFKHQASEISAAANAKALEEWDRAEAEWRENVSVATDDVSAANEDLQVQGQSRSQQQPSPPLLSPQSQKKQQQTQMKLQPKVTKVHPWSSATNEHFDAGVFEAFEPESSAFAEAANDAESDFAGSKQGKDVEFDVDPKFSASPLSDDEDSIFEFDKKKKQAAAAAAAASAHAAMAEKQREQAMSQQLQPNADPTSIFAKIKGGLKQADKTKKRTLGIEGAESGDTNDQSEFTLEAARRAQEEAALMKRVQTSPASETEAESAVSAASAGLDEKRKKRISFVAESENQIHTYTAPEESSVESPDYNGYHYDDDDDEEEDDSLTDSKLDVNSRTDDTKSAVSGTSTAASSLPSEKIGEFANAAAAVDRQISRGGAGTEEGSEADTYDDSTNADSATYKSEKSEDITNKDQEQKDLGLIGQIDNAVTMMAATWGGLFGVAHANDTQTEDKNEQRVGGGRRDVGSSVESTGGDLAAGTESRSLITDDHETDDDEDDNGTYGESTVQSTRQTEKTDGSEYDWLGYMRNIIFPRDAETEDGRSLASEAIGTNYSDYDADSTTYQEDEDSYLLQQALAAARAIHHVQGVEYDETQEINVLTDIKFVVVTVTLPLGLLFQEHEIGVWVSRVVPDGNGAKKGVQHGDQLAAINGSSSVHTTIDEVASNISSTPNNTGVELTFLRYVGPLRPVPGSIIQEGFEVTDTSVSPKKNDKTTSQKSKRSLFSKIKSSNKVGTPPSSPGVSTRLFGNNSPKSPKRATRSSPKYTNSPVPVQSNQTSGASMTSSSKASSSRQGMPSGPSIPSLSVPTKPSLKKKKSLGKMLSFKKKS